MRDARGDTRRAAGPTLEGDRDQHGCARLRPYRRRQKDGQVDQRGQGPIGPVRREPVCRHIGCHRGD